MRAGFRAAHRRGHRDYLHAAPCREPASTVPPDPIRPDLRHYRLRYGSYAECGLAHHHLHDVCGDSDGSRRAGALDVHRSGNGRRRTCLQRDDFGLGAGSYYMGRSFPEVLVALFPAWGLATTLLCLLALRALTNPSNHCRTWPVYAFPIAVTLMILGLFATSINQFPAPWTQWQRLAADPHAVLFKTGPASSFLRTATRPGEHVALLTKPWAPHLAGCGRDRCLPLQRSKRDRHLRAA